MGDDKNPAEFPDCFVMMPFGGYFDVYYRDIYVPAISSAGLQARRVDQLYGPNAIIQDIWRSIRTAPILVAELTTMNPNVLYELGLAHAAGKPVVLVSETIAEVPFDLRALRVLSYDVRLPQWAAELRGQLTQSLRQCLREPQLYLPSAFLEPSGTRATPSRHPPDVFRLEEELAAIRAQLATPPPNAGGPLVSTFSFWKRAILDVEGGSPSRVKALAEVLRDQYGIALSWEGIDERYRMWWSGSPGAPGPHVVAAMAKSLGMAPVKEGYTA